MPWYDAANLVTVTDEYVKMQCLVVIYEPLLSYYGSLSPTELLLGLGCS